MAGPGARPCPYHAVIEEILALGGRSQGAGRDVEANMLSPTAQLRAVAFVNRFHELPAVVPRATVRASGNGGVLCRWVTRGHTVEVVFLPSGGAYSVVDLENDEVVAEGALGEIDLLHDLVVRWVLTGEPRNARTA